jgi:hypothetical protein
VYSLSPPPPGNAFISLNTSKWKKKGTCKNLNHRGMHSSPLILPIGKMEKKLFTIAEMPRYGTQQAKPVSSMV